MKKQLQTMGLSLDWAREFATCDPSYYKHQQKMFLDFFKAGPRRAREAQAELGSGRHDRARQRAGDRRAAAGAPARGRAARDEPVGLQDHEVQPGTLDALDALDRWPDKVRLMQRNWIGRSEGMLIRFALDPERRRTGEERAEDLHHAATIPCSAPSSWRSRRIIPLGASRGREETRSSRTSSPRTKRHGTAQEIIDTQEKLGFDTGIKAIHPFDPTGRCRSTSRTSS
jgi:leucyl-tRNA synthetase